MKIAFFGTPDFTVLFLNTLEQAGLSLECIVTGTDVPVGRKLVLTSPLPKQWADEHAVTCYQPEKLDEAFITRMEKESYDLFIVVAYGKIMPEKLIHLPTYGTINVHYSLLPKYRGATPVESALLHGDQTTGVSIQHMRYALDSGPIIASKEIEIHPDDTTLSLRERLNKESLPLLFESITKLQTHQEETFIIQDETQQTHCKKIKKQDGLVTLDEQDEILYRKYRAYYGWPGIYFFDTKKDKTIRVKIEKASYKNKSFIIESVIPEGKKSMSWSDYQNWK